MELFCDKEGINASYILSRKLKSDFIKTYKIVEHY